MIDIGKAHNLLKNAGQEAQIVDRHGCVLVTMYKTYVTHPPTWQASTALDVFMVGKNKTFHSVSNMIAWAIGIIRDEAYFKHCDLEIRAAKKPVSLVAEKQKIMETLGTIGLDVSGSIAGEYKGKTTFDSLAKYFHNMANMEGLVFRMDPVGLNYRSHLIRGDLPYKIKARDADYTLASEKINALLGKTTKRGDGMFNTLIEVAKKKDEFQTQNGIESTIVKEAMELHASRQREAVANEIVAVMQQIESVKKSNVADIRNARRMEASAQKFLNLMDKCVAHANKTGNFCPALRLLGYSVPTENVPDDLQLK